MIPPELGRAVEDAVGAPIAAARRAGGGSIAASYEIDFAGGAKAFVKTHETLSSEAFAREAEGLAWLRETGTVRVPEVLATGTFPGAKSSACGFLVLERVKLSSVPTTDPQEEAFGRALAALHSKGAHSFGLWTSNYLAVLPQDNTPSSDWVEFYRERRLGPLVRRAADRGVMPSSLAQSFERLYRVLPERAGPPEPPARLHGDLWGGNRLVDGAGQSFVIDPAVYGGHREIDLAMMHLFGGFGGRVFEAYDEAKPLAPGAAERVALYQLYPLLAHLVMFGGGYATEVEDALASVL